MVAKTTLGYGSRTEAVMALRSQGLQISQIASRIGISPSTVSALECSALRSKARSRLPEEQLGRMILVPVDILNSMRRASSKRGMSPNQLARLIVEAVVDGNLIDAVLDDTPEDIDG